MADNRIVKFVQDHYYAVTGVAWLLAFAAVLRSFGQEYQPYIVGAFMGVASGLFTQSGHNEDGSFFFRLGRWNLIGQKKGENK